MLNPQTPFGMALGKPADDKTNPKPQQTSVAGDVVKPAAIGKTAPLGGKSTSSATSATASLGVDFSNINAASTNQQNSAAGFGGKLPSNKVEGALGQPEVMNDGKLKVAQPQKKPEGPSLSPFAQLKNDLFFYSSIQRGTLVQKDIQKLQKSFRFLTSDEGTRVKALQEVTKPEGKKYFQGFECLYNDPTDIKNWGIKFFVQIIEQLMHQIEYLSFNGALELLKRYININREIFYLGEKFNREFITKQCNLKILNEISSSVKSQPFFKKIVKQITFIKDLIFLEYHRFFKMLTSEQKQYQKIASNSILKSNKFFTNISTIAWSNFEFILKSQKKQIKNHFQLNIMLVILQAILHYIPKSFSQKVVIQKILPTIKDNLRLLQSSKHIKMSIFDQFFLHLVLIHPFSPEKLLKIDQSFSRYSYLRFFSNEPIRLDRPIQNAGGRIFIEALLQFDLQYSQYQPDFQSYVFTSIYNILKDNPKRFWIDKNGYKYIRSYIEYLQKTIQEYAEVQAQSEYKQYYDFYYVAMCRFAKLINLLCYPSQNEFISPQKLVKNKFVIRDFIQKSFEIIKMRQQSKDSLLETLKKSRISTEPIYQFFHRLIVKDPNQYFDLKTQYNGDYKLELELFGNYLWQYAQYGSSTSTCILAFTRLIEYRASNEVSAIMQDFAIIDQYHEAQQEHIHQKHYSDLEYIVKCLLRNNSNYIPLAKNILSIMKYLPNYNESPWMQRLLHEFKDLPDKPHPQNISQYAVILDACLKFVQHSPRSVSKVQQFFNFKFANRFLCHILEVSFQNKQIYNKYMRCAQYQPISIAVKLLKSMTELYRKEKDSNLGQLVPYQIRKLLQSQNKDGSYQIIMRNTAISYHLALINLLLSKQLRFDSDLHSLYPNLKNEILQTLINLNYINLDLKHQNSLKVAILYNKQQQDQVNKAINIKDELYEVVMKDPSYLGFQYLISAGSIDYKQKKNMFDRIKQIQLEENFSNMCSRSHFIYLYWKQIQNSKLSIQNDKGWQHVKEQMKKVSTFLDKFKLGEVHIHDLTLDDKNSLNQILKNIYDFSNLLKCNNTAYYTKFVSKYQTIFLSITLNKYFIIYDEHLSYSQSYRGNLLTFFGCRTFLTNKQFQQIVENEKNIQLFQFILGVIDLTYRKNYNIRNDNHVLEILEFAIAFLIQIKRQDKVALQKQLRQIRQQFINRPHRSTPMLTKQIIVLVLLNSQLSEKIECENIDFASKDWLLMMNAVQPSKKYSSLLITELFNIYEMHPIFFASTCHYLAQIAKTSLLQEIDEVQYYKNKKSTVNTLIDVLKKSIQAQRSFHVIWVIEVLIEMFMNKTINYHARQKYCSDIRIGILTLSLLHERISQLLSKIGSYYSTNYTNIWKCRNINDRKTSSKSTFSEKQQLLAYFRLLTFINFMNEQEKSGLIIDKKKNSECIKIENEIMLSCLRIIPLLASLLKDEKRQVQADKKWQEKVKLFQISKISSKSMQSSGIKQLSSQQSSQIWKEKSGLELLNEVSNFQLASLVVLWVSRYQQNLQKFDNEEFMQSNVQSFLKFLQILKVRIFFIVDNSKQTEMILRFINNKIYQTSVEVSKQMLFTNMQSLSSSLNLNYEQLKGKMVQSFILLYTLTMSIMKHRINNKIKIDTRLIKLADHLYRSSSKKLEILDKAGGLPFEAPPGYDNRSDMSFTKTRTMWSQRF